MQPRPLATTELDPATRSSNATTVAPRKSNRRRRPQGRMWPRALDPQRVRPRLAPRRPPQSPSLKPHPRSTWWSCHSVAALRPRSPLRSMCRWRRPAASPTLPLLLDRLTELRVIVSRKTDAIASAGSMFPRPQPQPSRHDDERGDEPKQDPQHSDFPEIEQTIETARE